MNSSGGRGGVRWFMRAIRNRIARAVEPRPVVRGLRAAAEPSVRVGTRGAVAASSHEATSIGVDVVAAGGTAVDASVAVAAALCVSQPLSLGLGGDLSAVLRVPGGEGATAVVACGPAPAGYTRDALTRHGLDEVPNYGVMSATVPAFVDGILALHRFATWSLSDLVAPAVELARSGVPVTDRLFRFIRYSRRIAGRDADLSARYLDENGDPPARGTVLRHPELADLLELLGKDPGACRDAIAEGVLAASERLDGPFVPGDFGADLARVGAAEEATCLGGSLHTTPAPTQGPLLLLAALVHERVLDPADDAFTSDHLLVETAKLVFEERLERLGDPDFVESRVDLSDDHVADLAGRIHRRRAAALACGPVSTGDTTAFACADAGGGIVASVPSNSTHFGAGVSACGGAVILANRLGRSASAKPDVVDRAEPGRRPVNTIHPWLLVRDDHAVAGGTPGGDAQITHTLAVLTARYREGRPWEQAVGRPRFVVLPSPDRIGGNRPLRVDVDQVARGLGSELRRRGHSVEYVRDVGGEMTLAISGRQPAAVHDGRGDGSSGAV